MSYNEIEEISRNISLIAIEIVMRDQTLETINNDEHDIIINLHPTVCSHWVRLKKREFYSSLL